MRVKITSKHKAFPLVGRGWIHFTHSSLLNHTITTYSTGIRVKTLQNETIL